MRTIFTMCLEKKQCSYDSVSFHHIYSPLFFISIRFLFYSMEMYGICYYMKTKNRYSIPYNSQWMNVYKECSRLLCFEIHFVLGEHRTLWAKTMCKGKKRPKRNRNSKCNFILHTHTHTKELAQWNATKYKSETTRKVKNEINAWLLD